MNYLDAILLNNAELVYPNVVNHGFVQQGMGINHPYMLRQQMLAHIQHSQQFPHYEPSQLLDYSALNRPYSEYLVQSELNHLNAEDKKERQSDIPKNGRLEHWKEILMVLAGVLMLLLILLVIKKLLNNVV